jgi:hypothetical protein
MRLGNVVGECVETDVLPYRLDDDTSLGTGVTESASGAHLWIRGRETSCCPLMRIAPRILRCAPVVRGRTMDNCGSLRTVALTARGMRMELFRGRLWNPAAHVPWKKRETPYSIGLVHTRYVSFSYGASRPSRYGKMMRASTWSRSVDGRKRSGVTAFHPPAWSR